jgi:hypothetical protein
MPLEAAKRSAENINTASGCNTNLKEFLFLNPLNCSDATKIGHLSEQEAGSDPDSEES